MFCNAKTEPTCVRVSANINSRVHFISMIMLGLSAHARARIIILLRLADKKEGVVNSFRVG